jgi:ABC-type sugar transport system substrate-binding protein
MRGLDGKWEEFAEQYPDVILFSADNMPEQMDLLNRGFADGLVGQQPADMGAKSIDTLLALSKGNDVDDFVATDLVVLARVNRGNPYNPLELSYANAASVMTCAFTSLLLLLACTVVGVFPRF